jgi:hypothetical protein
VRVISGAAERGPVVSSAVVLASLAILGFSVVAGLPLVEVSFVVIAVVVSAVAYRTLLAWQSFVVLLILVILFIPIRRYTLPGDLPFELEPYRLLVALILAAWLTSLLIDPRVRIRKSGFEGPILLFSFAVLASLLVNPRRVASVEPEVVKNLMFFLSFFLLFYLIVSVIRSYADIERLLKLLVAGGTIVAVLAVIEARTGFNPFNQLAGVIPFLEPFHFPTPPGRGARLRTFGPAQHPIALGAVLVLLVPLAIALFRITRRPRWALATVLIALGAISTVSRTSVIMLAAIAITFLWLRPQETKKLWPALLPALILIHFALPGTLGSLKKSFFPEGGLIQEQRISPGGRGSGRIVDIEMMLSTDFVEDPLVGQGFGTRVVDRRSVRQNALILDNQWLVTLLETGLIGFFAWGWLFWRFIRRLSRRAKDDPSPQGWLLAAIVASVAAYAVGMFTYDAWGFIQVTFVLFILLGFGVGLSRSPGIHGGDAHRVPSAGRPDAWLAGV